MMKAPVRIAVFLCLCQLLIGSATAQTFTILGTPTSPFKTSTTEGISIEVLTAIMEEIGIEDYRFELVDSVERAVLAARNGDVEMLISYSRKPERLAFLAYPDRSYRHIEWNFFIRKADEGKFTYNTLSDLKGYRIGVTEGVSYTKAFWQAERYLNFDYVNQNELQIKKLLRGRIDLVPLNTRSTLYEAEQAGIRDQISYLDKPLKDTPYYDPVCLHSPYFSGNEDTGTTRQQHIEGFLKEYDAAVDKLTANGFIAATYRKYGLLYDLH